VILLYRKIITIVVAALVVTALSVPAAFASGEGGTATQKYCLDGESMTLPVPVSADQGSRDLTQDIADAIIDETGGPFFFGFFDELDRLVFLLSSDVGDAEEFLEPGYTAHTITKGACQAAFVNLDRNFWLCYSKSQTDPAVYSRSQAIELFDAGYWVPYAVMDPLSGTKLNSGLYLVCNLPAGYTAKGGVAVSTGGGEMYDDPGVVGFVLSKMRLDYTTLNVKS